MFIVDLQCSEGHRFEGWYESTQDYYDRLNQSAITCPMCNSNDIMRRPSAAGIVGKRAKAKDRAFSQLGKTVDANNAPHINALTDTPMSLEVQKAVSRILQRIRQTHVDVGDEFARRAIAMARNEEPLEPILGQSTFDEEQQMDEEGIPYFKIPVPDIEKN